MDRGRSAMKQPDSSTRMLRSGFGSQVRSTSPSEPAFGFGTSVRDASLRVRCLHEGMDCGWSMRGCHSAQQYLKAKGLTSSSANGIAITAEPWFPSCKHRTSCGSAFVQFKMMTPFRVAAAIPVS